MNFIAKLNSFMDKLIGLLVGDVPMQIKNAPKIQVVVIVKIFKSRILLQTNSLVDQIVLMVSVMLVSYLIIIHLKKDY